MRAFLIGAMLAAVAGTAPAAGPTYHPSHNVYGQPDFEGVWSFNSLTRLVRPRDIPNLVMSEADAKHFTPASVLPHDQVGTADTEAHDELNYDWARLGGEIRSSWLIEPANGQLPYRPEGLARLRSPGGSDNPEGRSTYERCISMPQGGPPMLNAAYNNNLTFLQTRDNIAIQLEANHELRIIRLTDRAHVPAAASRWMGDSVGWYEGETLVVETVGFAPGQSDRRSAMTPVYMSPAAKVTERFTRISARQIRYEFVVDDPSVFSQTWRGELPLSFTTEPTFEYACHEGNYGLANILSGAREEEKRAKR